MMHLAEWLTNSCNCFCPLTRTSSRVLLAPGNIQAFCYPINGSLDASHVRGVWKGFKRMRTRRKMNIVIQYIAEMTHHKNGMQLFSLLTFCLVQVVYCCLHKTWKQQQNILKYIRYQHLEVRMGNKKLIFDWLLQINAHHCILQINKKSKILD